MIAELISIGTEVLMGNVVNTNAYFLSRKLSSLGFIINHIDSVGDNEKRILEVLDTAYHRADVIVTMGGLGPTGDDISKEVVAKSLDLKLVENQEAKKFIREYFEKSHREVKKEYEEKCMLMPEGAKLIKNDNGTAPGIIIEKKIYGKNIKVIQLPGPPWELTTIYNNGLDKYLESISDLYFYNSMVKMIGISESSIEKELSDLVIKNNPTFAPYMKEGEVHLRIVASDKSKEKAKLLVDNAIKEVEKRLGKYIYGYSEDTNIYIETYNKLKSKNMTVSFVESCTGGGLSDNMTDIAGASQVLKESFVTYSDDSKVRNIGVDNDIIKKYGVVSKEVALDMAKKLRDKTHASICISTTGNLGPEVLGDTEVGEVYIGFSSENSDKSFEYHFFGDRKHIKNLAIHAAYELLYNNI